MSDFYIESLIAESTGLVEKPVVKTYNFSKESDYDGDSDSLIKDWYKSVEDFNSYCTLDAIRDLHTSEKIRMLNNIKRVYGNSIEHYGAKLSIESYIDRTIMSIEEDKANEGSSNNSTSSTGDKKENPIIRFFKFIGRMVHKAFTIIKEKLTAFWGWLKKKINNLREKRSENLTQDIQNIEKEIDAVIEEVANENAEENSNDENDNDENNNNGGDASKRDPIEGMDRNNLGSIDPEKIKNRMDRINGGDASKRDPIEGMGRNNLGSIDPEKIKNRMDRIKGRINKCLEKLTQIKEKMLAESDKEVDDLIARLKESKGMVEKMEAGPALLKKPNAFKARMQDIKKRINDAKAKSANIKLKKAKIAEVIKGLGLEAVPDIRDNRGGSSKIDHYLNGVSNTLNFCNNNIVKIFSSGDGKNIHFPKNPVKESKEVFTDFSKFVTQILGWKMVSIRDDRKSTDLLEQVYTKDNIKKLGEFSENTIKRLNESCTKLQELTKRAEGIKTGYMQSTSPVNGGDGSTPENKNSVSEGNTIRFVKLKNIVKVNTEIINATISNMTKLTQISSKIISSLFDTGGGAPSSNSNDQNKAA